MVPETQTGSNIDQYAVFGDPIGHSKSPRIHQLFAQQTAQALNYRAQQVPAEHFKSTVQDFFAHGGKGINCTIPLKELAWQFADTLTLRAQNAKAVNTLTILPNGQIQGDNTDGIGLLKDLTTNHALLLKSARILILGAGGATRGIIEPLLDQAPQSICIANRTLEKAISLAAEFNHPTLLGCGFDALAGQQFDLIINATATSLTGTLPPLPPQILVPQGICYDLAYANIPTPFVNWGLAQQAAKSLDGLGMLIEQAAAAFNIWRQVYPNTAPIISLFNSERNAH